MGLDSENYTPLPPPTMEEDARKLAQAWLAEDSTFTDVLWYPHASELRLLQVTDLTPAMEPRVYGLSVADRGYTLMVCQITPAQLAAGEIPEAWKGCAPVDVRP